MRNENLKNLIKGMAFGVFIVAMMLTGTACSKKKSDNNNYDRYGFNRYGGRFGPGYGGGAGYGNGGQVVAGGESQGRAFMTLGIYSSGTGAAQVDGELEVLSPIQCNSGMEYLDADYYQLYATQQVQAGYGMISGAVFEAQGRYSSAIIYAPYITLLNSNVCGYQGMMAAVQVVSVNGRQCGTVMNIMDTYGAQMCQ